MAGDKINIQVKAFYTQNASPSQDPNFLNELVSLLTGGLVANGGTKGGATSAGISSFVNPLVAEFLTNTTNIRPYDGGRPKAFVNYIYFDENFNVVNSGVKQVEPGANAVTLVCPVNYVVQKHGYLYVFFLPLFVLLKEARRGCVF